MNFSRGVIILLSLGSNECSDNWPNFDCIDSQFTHYFLFMYTFWHAWLFTSFDCVHFVTLSDSHDADENNFELGNFKGTATESHCRSLFTNSDPSNLNQRDRHGNSAFSTTGLGIPRPRSFGKNCPKPNKNKRPASIAQGLNVYENSKDPISNKEEQTELTSDSQAALTGNEHSSDKWKRIVLLIIAITVHNIPEGLAVGVGFGAIGSTPSATFESAR